MTDEIVLTLRQPLGGAVDAAELAPEGWGELSGPEIGRRSVRVSGHGDVPVGDLFDIKGERSVRVRFVGDLTGVEGLGSGFDAGELIVEGNAGREVGARMRGGRIEVRGNAGWGAGLEMSGGVLEIHGTAGPRAGGAPLGAKRGMSGGEIVIRGSVGPEAGASMRRGLVAVGGDAADGAGRAALAGTVVVFGRTAGAAGQWSKRGTILALGPVVPLATYRYACTYRPQYVRLLLKYLRDRHRLPVTPQQLSGFYRRYSGDLAELGAGEILAWTAE